MTTLQTTTGPSCVLVPATPLTAHEKLALRLAALPPCRAVTLRIVTGRDGEPLAWWVEDEGRVEGAG